MKKHSLKDWMIAVRPWSFPASSMPVVVTLAYLYWMQQDINWVNGIWALLNIVVFHAAGNTWSDYFDYKHKVDARDTFGAKTLTDGMFAPREIYGLSMALLAVALVAGVGLLVIFLAYALLPTLGTCYVATGVVDWNVLWIALPVGLITVAILHANNTRDMRTDARAEIQTLAMKLGGKASMYVYCAEVLFPFGWIAGLIAAGTLPLWTLLVMPALVPAIGNVRVVSRFPGKGESAIAGLDEMTAKLQLLFSLLFTLSFVVAGLLS